eukprot:COSAG02_NODE_337_length_24268_cov_7.498738_14_plen_101_part_00
MPAGGGAGGGAGGAGGGGGGGGGNGGWMCVAFVISHVSITFPLPPLPLFHTCWYVSVDAVVVVKMPYAPPVPWIRPQSAGGFPSVEFGPVPGTAPLPSVI